MSKLQKTNSTGGDTQEESVKELFHQNDIQATRLVTLTMLLLSAGLILYWVLNMLGIFQFAPLDFDTKCSIIGWKTQNDPLKT